MRKKKTTKRKKRVVIVTPTVTTSNTLQSGDIIWYDAKKSSLLETALNYVKGWFR